MLPPDWPLDHSALASLAPDPIPSYRRIRYDGDGMAVPLERFPLADRELLAKTYAALGELQLLLSPPNDQPVEPSLLSDLLARHSWKDLVAGLRRISLTPRPDDSDTLISKVVHDLKGGAFTALATYIQLFDLGIRAPDDLRRIFFLARDQRKIMRNSLRGLDEPGQRHDSAQNLHSVALLTEKWGRGDYRLGSVSAQITILCAFNGNIAERCLEFAALDRVIYNLVNNAARNSADGRVYLAIQPLAGPEPHDLRFIVANRVTAEQAVALAARFPAGPGDLFHGGFTTGGSGLGMRISADFIANAYGLANVAQGLAEGHFGARLHDDLFVAWFHWPVAAE